MIGRALVVLTVDGQELQLRFTYYRPPRKWYVEFLDVEFLGDVERLRRMRFDHLETAIILGQAMIRRQIGLAKGGKL